MTHTSPCRALSQLVNRKLLLAAVCLLALGLMSAFPITSTASPYRKLEIILDPALSQETSGNGNGIIEAGETGKVGFRVINQGFNEVYSTYVNVHANEIFINDHTRSGTWEEGDELIFVVDVEVPCSTGFGYSVEITMLIEWHVPFGGSGRDIGSGSLWIEEQPLGNANTISYTGPPVAIPDNSATGVDIPLEVENYMAITDLDFIINGSSCNGNSGVPTMGLDHANVHDLVLKLTSPQGTTVTLVDRPGDSTNTGSNFCNMALDDDQFNPSIQSIASGGAPYPGTFAPANPLAAFIGEDPYGTWTLNVSDHAANNTGMVNAFSLTITDNSSVCDYLSQAISGRVTTDGTTGLSDVKVNIVRQRPGSSDWYTPTTDANGNYLVSGLPHSGRYTVKPSKLGYIFNPAKSYFSVLDTDVTADFVATEADFTIGGRVLMVGSSEGLSGVTMNLTGDRVASVTTDTNGSYAFPDLPASGNYTVTPFMIGYKFTSTARNYYDLTANQANQNFTAKVQNYTVGGVVRLGAARLQGVTVTLSSPTPDGFPARTATTSSTGLYSFTNVPSGRNYTVTPTKDGYQFTPLNKSLTNLSANHTAVNFAVKVYSISGRITRRGTTTGIGAVTVTLTSPRPAGFPSRTVKTTTTGLYTFRNIPAGRNYTIKAVKTGFTFSPVTRSITNLHNNIPAGALTNFTGSGP